MVKETFEGKYRKIGWLYLSSGLLLIILSLTVGRFLDIPVFMKVFRFFFFTVGVILLIGAFLHYFVRVVEVTSEGVSSGIRLIGGRRKAGWSDIVEIKREMEHKAFLFGGIYGLQLGTKVTNSVYARTEYGRKIYLYALEEFDEDELTRLHGKLREYCSEYGVEYNI
ncbi:MAG: hypothetical protein ACQESD_06355 [Thermoplasmatota archaeon]